MLIFIIEPQEILMLHNQDSMDIGHECGSNYSTKIGKKRSISEIETE